MAAEADKVVITRIPPFTGKPEEWEFWRSKFEAVLYGKGMQGDLASSKPVVRGRVRRGW